jgi:hypothetical protein
MFSELAEVGTSSYIALDRDKCGKPGAKVSPRNSRCLEAG